jgi:hypothetical protein
MRFSSALSITVVVALGGGMMPVPSYGAVINFTTPDFVGTTDCVTAPAQNVGIGAMELYQEAGVRMLFDIFTAVAAYKHTCDVSVPVPPGLPPFIKAITAPGPNPYGPVPIWGNDSASIEVISLFGDDLLGLRGRLFDDLPNQACGTATISGVAQSGMFSIPICPGFQGPITFAAYGLFGVEQFKIFFPLTIAWQDPLFYLDEVTVVPEPASLLLLIVAAAGVQRRFNRRQADTGVD